MAPCKSLQALVIFRLCAAFTIHFQFADSVQLIFTCFLSEERCIALFCGICIPVGGGGTLNSSQYLYMCFAAFVGKGSLLLLEECVALSMLPCDCGEPLSHSAAGCCCTAGAGSPSFVQEDALLGGRW